jgi:hypothetical protein
MIYANTYAPDRLTAQPSLALAGAAVSAVAMITGVRLVIGMPLRAVRFLPVRRTRRSETPRFLATMPVVCDDTSGVPHLSAALVHVGGIIVLLAKATDPPVGVPARLKRALTAVKQHVVRVVLADYEVLRAIIRSVLVQVVNWRGERQRPTHSLFDYQYMLKDIIVAIRSRMTGRLYKNIPVHDRPPARPSTVVGQSLVVSRAMSTDKADGPPLDVAKLPVPALGKRRLLSTSALTEAVCGVRPITINSPHLSTLLLGVTLIYTHLHQRCAKSRALTGRYTACVLRSQSRDMDPTPCESHLAPDVLDYLRPAGR